MTSLTRILIVLFLIPTGMVTASPQDKSDANKNIGVSFGEPVSAKWRVGAAIRAKKSNQAALVTLPIPNNWPEQRVSLLEESLPTNARTLVDYRNLKTNHIRQMVAKIPSLPRNVGIKISVIVEVQTREMIKPADTTLFRLPKSSHKVGKPYLAVTPFVNYKKSKLKNFAKELTNEVEPAWEKVAAIYDWVRDEVEQEDAVLSTAYDTFLKKAGCNEDKIFLFVALCRAVKIPARIVYANEFNYAEFMLTDEEGKQAYWFPANINGVYELGGLAEPRIILQKGHHVKVPEKENPQKYVAEFISVTGTSRPAMGTFRGQVEDEDDSNQ